MSAVASRSSGVVALTSVIFVCITTLGVITALTGADLTALTIVVGMAAPTITGLLAALRVDEVRTEVRGLVTGVRGASETQWSNPPGAAGP